MDLTPYKLIIFDKDGTLIDFDHMWGGWVEGLAARLEALTGREVAGPLYAAMGYDASAGRTLAGGRLAVTSMAALRALTADVLQSQGLAPAEAESALQAAWSIPDVAIDARPLADLPRLFGTLRQRGLKIAVVTSDDRAPTLATLAALGVDHLVDAVVAADDGLPLKPRPDMLRAACRATGVEPRQAVVVGDGLPELEMARSGGAGLAVGVASGVSRASALAPHADFVLSGVADLLA